MVKLNDIEDVGKAEIVRELIKEEITKQWLKNILLGNRFRASHHSRDTSESEFFVRYVWDNLTPEQQKKVIEAVNQLIEEDILIEKQPDGNYCFHLLDLAIILEKKVPGKINSKPFLIWKEKDYFNLPQPIDHNHYVIKNLDEKIENAFEKKN